MNKKVFISYSWGDNEHQEWVVNLGKRLMSDTVDVVLDRWSLKDGHDIHSFMEEMVKSEDIFRVLIISDSIYTSKADQREGGVGTETQIITPKLYSKEKQDKFIPLLLERNENGEPYLPVYLSNRKYIDFSREEDFEDSYEELLRNILEKPSIPKPKLGTKPPAYISETNVDLSDTNNKIRTIQNQVKKNSTLNRRFADNFINAFSDQLWNYNLEKSSSDVIEYGKNLIDILNSFKPLKEDFISFIDILTSYEIDYSGELIIEFFENSLQYLKPRDDRSSWSSREFDTFEIIFHELFIYAVAFGLKNKNYLFLEEILNSKYFVDDPYYQKQEPSDFDFLNKHHEYLENYMHHQYNKITGFGHYTITNLSDQVEKKTFVLADTLCYTVSYLKSKNDYDYWFPHTYLYGKENNRGFFEKFSSKKYFDKVKSIFNVVNEGELKNKLKAKAETNKERIRYSRGGFNTIPHVYNLINPDKIGIYR